MIDSCARSIHECPSPSVQSTCGILYHCNEVASFVFPAPPYRFSCELSEAVACATHAPACIVMQRQILKPSLLAQGQQNLLKPPKSAQRITASHYFLVRPMFSLEWRQVLQGNEQWILAMNYRRPTANRLGPRVDILYSRDMSRNAPKLLRKLTMICYISF